MATNPTEIAEPNVRLVHAKTISGLLERTLVCSPCGKVDIACEVAVWNEICHHFLIEFWRRQFDATFPDSISGFSVSTSAEGFGPRCAAC